MFLWNINTLAEKIKNQTFSNKKLYTFYFFSFFLTITNSLLFSSLLFSHQFIEIFFLHFLELKDSNIAFYNWIGLFSALLTTLISIVGWCYCYKINKQGDNKDFSKRMAFLSFPINFHLTVYVLALLTILIFFSYLIVQGKITFFKQEITYLIKSQSNIGAALQQGLSQTPFKNFVTPPKTSGGIFKFLLSSPILLVKLPILPQKIKFFIASLRASILIIYPFIALLPPLLSFLHYWTIKNLLKKIAFQ